MTRKQLIKKLQAEYPQYKKDTLYFAVYTIFEEITKSLERREEVFFRGFGRFYTKRMKSKLKYSNLPRHEGKEFKQDYNIRPAFRAGKELSIAINS